MATATQESTTPYTDLDNIIGNGPIIGGIPIERLGAGIGSFVIFGHYEPRQIIAAVCRASRQWGLIPPTGSYVEAAAAIQYTWIRLIDQCEWLDRPDHTDDCGLCEVLQYDVAWHSVPAAADDPCAVPVAFWRTQPRKWRKNHRGQWVLWGDELEIPEAGPDAPTGPYPPDQDLQLVKVTQAAAEELGYPDDMCTQWVNELAAKHAAGWSTERIVASLRCRFVDTAPAAQPGIVEFVTSRLAVTV